MARRRLSAGAFAASGLASCAVYPFVPDEVIRPSLGLLIGAASALAVLKGSRRTKGAKARPWQLMFIACVLFLTGLVVRPWAVRQSGFEVLAGEVFTIAGYGFFVSSFMLWLRRAQALDKHAVIDGFVICLGALVPTIQFLSVPAADSLWGQPLLVVWVGTLYPLADLLSIFLLANLVFTTATRLTSFRLLVAAVVLGLFGDLGYAMVGRSGDFAGTELFDLAFLASFVLMGTAALHPTSVSMARITAKAVQPWSMQRLVLIFPAVILPLLVVAVADSEFRITATVLLAVLVAGVLMRAIFAVRDLSSEMGRSQHRATHDRLTGLANRDELMRRIDDWRESGRDVWLCYFDLDGFKLVNDHWGHSVGDELLVAAARRLTSVVQAPSVVARVGGDEFIVAGCGSSTLAEQVSLAVLESFRTPFAIGDREFVTTASVGVVASTTAGPVSAADMLRDADVAMYRAKQLGRDRSIEFGPAMREEVNRRVETEVALRRALAQRELWVAYQPLIDLHTESVVGAEALIRWTTADGKPVSPELIISVAEDSGLIHSLGSYVLAEAIGQLASWRKSGLVSRGFSMSVNVSPAQLDSQTLVGHVVEQLELGGVPADRLTLEVTESALMKDLDESAALLWRLRDLGVQVAVDDFGTGYSSLSYLSQLPINDLKIDRSFVNGLGADDRSKAIVRAIIGLGRSLGIGVTVEGVERADQRDLVQALGADKGQGWLWGKAEAPTRFEQDYLAGSAALGAIS